uniref:Outer capsid glycoprotein VP7 n=9 Tax=Rotavirus B TaxID=28876 RepID=Q9WAT1_9REOV|nr:outer capsid protein VP7 [Bovine group B rotavirus]BAV57414.1 outer capsid protein VP7 [Bovine group B rotavirus]BAV57415.1 outer capsid protein VP7 [Bovine group B rotavirus]BAV57416.1 outer capsid protein VP7 [Bovine group B rotavirus]BAV57417.1 outer capsid protein VP7 [Bovine group B rotavirus]
MALPLLLVFAACAKAQLVITPISNPEICVLHASDWNVNSFGDNFTNIFETYNSVTLSFYQYDSTNYDVIDIISKRDYSLCHILAIDVIKPEMDFITFLQSNNECSKYAGQKIHYQKLSTNEEWFVYSKNLKFCPLSDSLIGLYCDTQINGTYFPLSENEKYDVTDLPEFTEMGYVFYSNDDFYICKRINEDKWVNYHLFYREYSASGTVSRAISWDNVWTGFKTFAQVVYKILDIFFNNRRNFEPRA